MPDTPRPQKGSDIMDPFRQIGKIHGKAAHIIAECANSGEPVFVFRAKDLLSIFALKEYELRCEQYGADPEMAEDIAVNIRVFQQWQQEHRNLVRFPD